MIDVLVASFGGVLVFAAACYLIGGALPRSFLFAHRSLLWQRLAVGWATLIVVLRFPLREDLPPSLAVWLLFVLALLAVTNDLRFRRGGLAAITASVPVRKVLPGGLLYAIPLLPLLAMFYFPLFADRAIFYRNFGPDIIGNLISASYIADGKGFGDLLAAFSKSIDSFSWWHSSRPDPWRLLDLRDSIAIEFFLRSVRWGHAVLAVFVGNVTGAREWFGFYVVVLFSLLLLPLLLIDECRKRGLTPGRSILVATLAVSGQSYVLMHYEGIGVQLLATPFLLFLILVSEEAFLSKIGFGQRLVYALIASALMTTFGEGIQLLAMYSAILVALWFVPWGPRLTAQSMPRRDVLLGVATTIALAIAISPALTFDFASWSYVRLKDSFDGGALHFHYSLASILTQFPYIRLGSGGGASSIHLLFAGGTKLRVLEASALLIPGIVMYYRKINRELLALATVIFLVVLTEHRYAIWKTAVVFQPLLLVLFAQLNWGGLLERAKRWALPIMLVFALLGQGVLMWQYHRHAIKMNPAQFEISKVGLAGPRYAIITPSQADSYLYLATVGPLNWVNGGPRQFGLPADFSAESDRNLQVALYFDCDAEGAERCEAIRQTHPDLPERVVLGTAMKASDFVDPKGLVITEELNRYVEATFGVGAR